MFLKFIRSGPRKIYEIYYGGVDILPGSTIKMPQIHMAREMMYQKLKCSGPVMDELWLEMDGNWMIQVFLLTMLDGKRLMVNIQ